MNLWKGAFIAIGLLILAAVIFSRETAIAHLINQAGMLSTVIAACCLAILLGMAVFHVATNWPENEDGKPVGLPKLSPMAWKIASIPLAAVVGWIYGGIYGAGVLAAVVALVWWKIGGGKLALSAETPSEKQQALQQSKTLYWASFLPEAVNAVLIAAWAYSLHSNPWIGAGVVVGFIGFIAMRVSSVPATVNAVNARAWGRLAVSLPLSLLTTAALISAGIFELVNDSGYATQAKIETSDQAAKLDADIDAARKALAAASQYADAGQVKTEAENREAAETKRQARIGELNAAIAAKLSVIPANKSGKSAGQSLANLTGNCSNSSWYTSTYCGDVVALQKQLDSLQSGATVQGEYATGHADYQGKKAYLAELEAKRKALGNGESVTQSHRPDDRLIGEFSGIDPERASWWKFIVLGVLFDLLTLLARVNSQQLLLAAGGDKRGEVKRKVAALVNYADAWGIDLERILPGNLAGGAAGAPAASIPPAQVLRPWDELPALDTGGKILADGGAILHKGERVLNVAAVEAIEALHPGLLDRANAGVPVGTIEPANGSNKPDSGTVKPKATKPAGTLEPQAVRQQFDTTSEPGTVRHRYDYIKALILDGKLKGKINPRRIRDIPYNGTRMGHAPAKRFYHQLVKEGVIKDEL